MKGQLGRSRVSLRFACCTLLAASLTYACGGGGSDTPTQPKPPAVDRTPIRIITGGGQTDTVGAVLLQALVVEIHDTTGKILPGATARFTPVGAGNGPASLLLSPVSEQSFGVFASDVADAQGRAKTLVKLGPIAGTAKLEIAVPELGATDTISFTVKPGAPARFDISPRDTTIPPGASYTLKVQTTDRFSNPIASAVPTYSATGVTVTSAGVVTGANTTARAEIVVAFQGLSDSASVSVVPKIPLVMDRNHAVVLINSDGTGATTIATSPDQSLSPSSVAATPSVVYYQGDPGYSGKVWVAQPNASPRVLLPGVARPEGWPRLSPDGTWVYFIRDYKSLWRVHLDGTGLDSLTSFVEARIYSAPTISPDGNSVAIEDGPAVQIYDITTRTPRTLSVTCGFPRYSPDGAWFSCQSSSDVSVMRTDGTGQRVVTSILYGVDGLSGVDWTPDGKWLLVTSSYQGAQLVEVATGSVLPLTGLGYGFFQASVVR
jgi:Tol biopolymer transport system component